MAEVPSDVPPLLPPQDAPPPGYAPSQPQILIAPLPDSASFFWGRTVQGEVFVKGLGERRGQKLGVKTLSVQLRLTNHLRDHPTIPLHTFPAHTLYPLPSSPTVSSSAPSEPDAPFSTSHRFSIPVPPAIHVASPFSSTSNECPLPGTLNLSAFNKGEIRWSLVTNLSLLSGQEVNEEVRVEGTPQELETATSAPDLDGEVSTTEEVEERLEKDGVSARLLLDQATPRLGDLLRLGVEVRPKERQRTGVAGLSSQPNPAETLRPLRRVRVELFRRVDILDAGSSEASSSSTPPSQDSPSLEHLTLLHASGKSLRYPGTGRNHPPLRVLFTVPTIQLGNVADQTWGEINMKTPYHIVSFFIRVTIGFGTEAARDWVLQRDITIRSKIWQEPREVVIERGQEPALGLDSAESPDLSGSISNLTDEQIAREAYRQKGRDVVGGSGTYRHQVDGDMPPPFEGAGPSSSRNGLPTFLESEEQMRSGEVPLPNEPIRSERLIPVPLGESENSGEPFDRSTWAGRRGSLGGELGTWIEYDGYETFSVQPPSAAASFGVGGSMDPPQEGDDGVNVAGGIAARLGLDGTHVGSNLEGMQLMEQLGLGEGTRVIDLQDDLPPGIDEPSLPALPSFHPHPHHTPTFHQAAYHHSPPQLARLDVAMTDEEQAHDPPSFDASQAANAAGGVASSAPPPPSVPLSTRRPSRHASVNVGNEVHSLEAPPGYGYGYEGTTRIEHETGLPPYS